MRPIKRAVAVSALALGAALGVDGCSTSGAGVGPGAAPPSPGSSGLTSSGPATSSPASSSPAFSSPPTSPPSVPSPTATSGPPSPVTDPVVLAAGDIAHCGATGDEATAELLAQLPDATIVTTGDNAYPSGTAENFASCYDPNWGQHKARTRPAPGNHDYRTAGAAAYFDYFGPAAGEPGKGYYSYDLGSWHLIALNSNCEHVGGCGAGSPQERWLRADLAAHPRDCTLAYWHEPRFSSSQHGNSTATDAFWKALYAARADVVLGGHDHVYERFAPQSPAGVADRMGVTEFVVGTGGARHYGFEAVQPNSVVREGDTFGVLKLQLHKSSYDWEFLPVAGDSFDDSGSAACVTG